jgi:DNA repair exonuclease SbcCD ATPase subunit
MSSLNLPDLDSLPTLDESERWGELLDSIAAAKERREKLRQRAEKIEQELPEHAERIEDLRVAVATSQATESDLDAAKEKRAELREELEELREEEIPAQIDTIELLEDRRSEVKSEEGDKFASEYAEVQRALQKRKRELLEGLAEVLEALDEYQGLKKSNDVGSYDPDVPDVPQVHPTIQGPARNDRVKPERLRRRADELADTLETLDAE